MLPLLLAGYVAGLLAAAYFPDFPWALPPLLMATALPALLPRLGDRWRRTLLLLAFCGAGLLAYRVHITPPAGAGHIATLDAAGPWIIEGMVLQHERREPGGARMLIETRGAGRDARLQPVSGRLALTVENDGAPVHPGDQVRFSTQLRKPRRFGTPGEFDTVRHFARRGVFVTAFVADSRDIARFAGTQSASPLLILQRYRQRVANHIDATIDAGSAPLLRALATGDRGGIGADQRALLARGGIAHLFAISGLHLGLVAGLLYFGACTLYRQSSRLLLLLPPQRLLPLALLPPLAAYLLFTGSALSTWRALLLLALAAAASLLQRRPSGGRLLLAAAALLLFCDPLALFEASFQLSFAGAAGIVTTWPRWQPLRARLHPLLAAPLTILVLSAAATLATLPFVLLHFHLFAPAGLLLNLVAIPVVSLVAVPATLAGIILLPLFPGVATACLTLAAFCLDRLLAMTAWCLDLPGLSGSLHFLSPTALLLLGSGAAALLLPVTRWPRRAGLLVLPALLAAGWSLLPGPGTLTVVPLSVGQGDAILLQTPAGGTYLVDGGGLFSTSFDTGERLVAPALGYLGVRRLDAVLLSHPHPDHFGGLAYILQQFPVGALWSACRPDGLPAPLRATLMQRGIPLRTFPPGWTAPDPAYPDLLLFAATGNLDANDASLVAFARCGDDGVLLTGDLGEAGIRQLASSPPPGPVSLLKLPHHGSRTSLPQPLLERHRPPQAFVSVGAGNRYGQPHPAVLAQLDAAGTRLLRTDRDGTLRYRSTGSGWHAQTWRNGLFH